MSIDLSENGNGYHALRKHIGHAVVCVGYDNPEEAPANIAIECEDCNEVLVSFDEPEEPLIVGAKALANSLAPNRGVPKEDNFCQAEEIQDDDLCNKFKCARFQTVDNGRGCKICRYSNDPKVCPKQRESNNKC